MRTKFSKQKLIVSFGKKIRTEWLELSYEEVRKKIFELSSVDITISDVRNACKSIGIDRKLSDELRRKNAKTKFNPWGSCK